MEVTIYSGRMTRQAFMFEHFGNQRNRIGAALWIVR
jgi:hypothetical protein